MSWLESLRGLWRRYQAARNPPRTLLRVVDGVLEATAGAAVQFRISQEEIAAVELYKRDLITIDDVCAHIFLDGEDVRWISEDMDGWSDAIRWLETLPGFDLDWWPKVVQPPFLECRLRVYQRPEPPRAIRRKRSKASPPAS